MYSHSCHYHGKIGDCATTYLFSLLKKLSFGVTFQHPFCALVHGLTNSDTLSYKALLDYVHKDGPLFRSTRIKSCDFDYVLSKNSISGSIVTCMVNILQGIKLILFWCGQRDDWFNQFGLVSFGFLRNLFLNLHHFYF